MGGPGGPGNPGGPVGLGDPCHPGGPGGPCGPGGPGWACGQWAMGLITRAQSSTIFLCGRPFWQGDKQTTNWAIPEQAFS